MNKPQFVYVSYIATTEEKLWSALTNDEFTRQYWGGRQLQSTWELGASITLQKPQGEADVLGKVLHYEPTSKLMYSFHDQQNEQTRSEEPSCVTFELQPQGGMIKLSVTHEGFAPDSAVFPGISKGWPLILSGLKTLLETGKTLLIEHPDCGD